MGAAIDRRRFLVSLGLGAAGVALLPRWARAQGSLGGQAAPAVANPPGAPSAEVRELFGELVPGARVGDYTIVAVHGVHLGAIPVVLRHTSGRTFQVDVQRRGPSAGVARTAHLDLYLSNGGGRTDEREGLGAMALAAALREREREGAHIPALLTLCERRQHHPSGRFRLHA